MNQKEYKKIQKDTQYRSFEINRSAIDEENRTVELSFSSAEPYERYWGIEILGHKKEEIDLSRLNNKAAFLLQHDPDRQVGVVLESWIEDNKGKAKVKFSKSKLGQEVFQDILDEVRNKISVGYQILNMIKIKEEKGLVTYRVDSWLPFEISSVSIPADDTVGIGRSQQEEQETEQILPEKSQHGESNMENNEVKEVKEVPTLDINAEREKIRKEEASRVKEIRAIADQVGLKNEADQFISEGRSVEEFKSIAIQKFAEKQKPVETAEIGLSKKETERFSLSRAIDAAASGNWREAGFEREVIEETAKKQGKKIDERSIIIPYDILNRDLTVSTEGTDIVQTDKGSLIEKLYAKTLVKQMGATVLTGLVGNVDLPRVSGGATVYWQSTEGSATTESTPTFDKVSLSPSTAQAFVDVSRNVLNQASFSAENMILNDIARAMAVAADTAAINGSGSSGQPTGIINTSNINSVTISSSTGLVWSEVVEHETEVATDSADMGSLAYLTHPKVRGYMKSNMKNATYGSNPMWENGQGQVGIVNGYNGYASSCVPSTLGEGSDCAMIFGNWSDLVIAEWGGLEILVDPYSSSSSGLVRFVVFFDMDIGVRHPESFAVSEGITIS